MRHIVTFLIVLVCAYILYTVIREDPNADKETISISGAWALYPLMGKWAEDYQKLDTSVVIDVTGGGAGKGMTEALSKMVDLGMVSREVYPEEKAKGAWHVGVAEDAVVPTMCRNNPHFAAIQKRGLTADSLRAVFITGEIDNWRMIAGAAADVKIQVYSRSDACGAKETFAAFLKSKQDDFKGVGILGDPGIADEVAKNALSVGYNNIGYFFNPNTKKPHTNLAALPIDLNGNGVIDPEENFYEDRDALIKAIMDGRYPRPPARELYVVSQGKPEKPAVRRFLRWILTEGQKEALEAGYIPLSEPRAAELLKTLED